MYRLLKAEFKTLESALFPNKALTRFTSLSVRHPQFKGLYLVEGVQYNADADPQSPWPQWWGGNMHGAKKHPIKLASADADSRLVYSPHIYGPSVYEQEYFKEPTFPDNLAEVWDNQFGFLIPELKKGVIIGEWGGSCLGKDLIVQEKLGQWLQQNCMANNVWWSLNPGSEDTGK